jgi:hypothetical protein
MTESQYRQFLISCLNLACTRVNDARLSSLNEAMAALLWKDVSNLDRIALAGAALRHEDRRRQRILSAVEAKPRSTTQMAV